MSAAAAMEANPLLDAALSYAAMGLPVFPCNPSDKTPLVRNGLHDASADTDTVVGWWTRWPTAMIGVPTGSRTKFWALDIDDPGAFEAACPFELPATRRCDTGKGYHLLFKWDPAKEVRNKQRHPKRGWPFPELPGAETRGEGGYVIVPPSIHPTGRTYAWHGDAAATDAPAKLYSIVRRAPANDRGPTESQAPRPRLRAISGNNTAYGKAALEAECELVRGAGNGEQEAALNEAGLKLGALVAGGELSEDSARTGLIDAGLEMTSFDRGNPWTRDAIERKVDRALGDGAANPRSAPKSSGVGVDDFHAYMPAHNYIFGPSGEAWPATSVNSRIPPIPLVDKQGQPVVDEKGNPVELPANKWLDQHRPVEQMTWAPGEPQVVRGRLISDGGWIERPGCNVFNLYRPPVPLRGGDASQADPWVDHIKRIYSDDWEHLIRWLAHRVQRPQEKVNHALLLGGEQGIGKDTILEPVKAAIGPWNFTEVSPGHMLGRFNSYVKSVILRVSEARDLGDVDRFAFYDHMKIYTAAPPDVLRVDEKNVREYAVFNLCGVIITTNHKTDGLYLPADDRRHYVAWSNCTRADFGESYWNKLYGWYADGGTGHVVAYLSSLPLERFDAKAPPPKTAAFWDIVSSNQAPEEAELADALETLCWPNAVTIHMLADAAHEEFSIWLRDRRNSRAIPHKLGVAGYVNVRNDAAKDGLFKVGLRRCAIYAKRELDRRDALVAAQRLERGGR